VDDEVDVARFARSFELFLDRFREVLPPSASALRTLATDHLGADPSGLPAFTERLDPSEHANLQLALDAFLSTQTGWSLVGLPSELHHFGGFSLASILAGRFHGPAEPCAPEFVRVPIDVDQTHPCLRLGVYLLTYDEAPLIVLVGFSEGHGPRPGLLLDVVASDAEHAAAFVARIRELMHEHNVFRGKVLSFAFTEWGGFGITFHSLPAVARDAVVLPEADLDAIERHTIGVSRNAGALLAAGRHLKRGLLLYGPPGTGKTLSVMYLCGQLPGRTTLLLSGPGAGALGQAAAIARAMQPSMVVLEDVDLVAMERTRPGLGTNPLLFQLLNEMDGLGDDADVVFVLTTNRVDLLEPALAARPGRIDQAVEIGLPDLECRTRLIDLYLRDTDFDGGDLGAVIDATEGVTASFIKELVRRAVLVAALERGQESDESSPPLTVAHVASALDDLLHHSAPILRSSLGANPGVAEAAGDEAPGQSGGWFAHSSTTSATVLG
jgi:hypothetical protein